MAQHGSGATGSSNGAPLGVPAAPSVPESPQNSVQTPAETRLVPPLYAAATFDPPGRQSTGSSVSPAVEPGAISAEDSQIGRAHV